jgi:hypothetical protein
LRARLKDGDTRRFSVSLLTSSNRMFSPASVCAFAVFYLGSRVRTSGKFLWISRPNHGRHYPSIEKT